MSAFYNDTDPYVAKWLRNLIAAGLIAPGVVDERSIEDVRPEELMGYTQCHFFAGIGVWSLALRAAGWPDDYPVWTGSCPCQPFSTAGQGAGFDDERHLWPAFHFLIAQCRPAAVLGEQVSSKDADPWIDLVHTDLEALGYAVGAVPFPSAGIGAPHIRDRLYWVALAEGQRRSWRKGAAHGSVAHRDDAGRLKGLNGSAGPGEAGLWLADAKSQRLGQGPKDTGRLRERDAAPGHARQGLAADGADDGLAHTAGAGLQGGGPGWSTRPGREGPAAERGGAHGGLGHADSERAGWQPGAVCAEEAGEGGRRRDHDADASGDAGGLADSLVPGLGIIGGRGLAGPGHQGAHAHLDHQEHRPGPNNGFWRDADWLLCRDGRWRPVESGTFPLATGAPARVGRLRAYGNAVNKEAAQVFIEAVMESMP